MAMQLLFINSGVGGHHFALYGCSIFREAAARGWTVKYLTGVEGGDHPMYQEIRDELGSSFVPVLYPFPSIAAPPSALKLLQRQMSIWKDYRAAFRTVCRNDYPDHVLVGNLEDLDKATGLRGGPFADIPFSGIHLSVRFHYAATRISDLHVKARLLQEWLFYRLLSRRTLHRLFTVDSSLPDVARESSPATGQKVTYVPDCAAELPVIDRQSARRALGIPSDSRVILVFGYICQRKSVRELIEAVADPSISSETFVVLMGTHDGFAKSLLSEPSAQWLRKRNRLVSVDGFVSTGDEAAAYAAADYAWCVYKDFDISSGVAMQAARNRIPVVAGPRGLIARYVRESHIGHVVNDDCQNSITRGLGEILDGSRTSIDPGDLEKFAGAHTSRGFASSICDAIEDETSV
jgi:hypothetical protein